MLPLVDDPDTRSRLLQTRRGLRRRIGGTAAVIAAVLVVAGLGTAAAVLDSRYSETAPYRTATARTADPAPAAAGLPVPVPVPGPPTRPKTPGGASASPPKIGFPSRTALPEEVPWRPDVPRSQPEQRWCQFNEVRLRAALNAAPPDRESGVRALMEERSRLCARPAQRGRDADQVNAELEQRRDRLDAEGRAMLDGGEAR